MDPWMRVPKDGRMHGWHACNDLWIMLYAHKKAGTYRYSMRGSRDLDMYA